MPAYAPSPASNQEADAHTSADPVRQRILTEARRHFMAHGFRGVTMDDLAAELAMSKKTLYAHFPGKAVLLQAVLDDKFRSADAEFTAISGRFSSDFMEALQDLLTCLRKQVEELQPPFMRDMAREAPELFQMVQARRRMLIQRHFGKLIGEGTKAGLIRTDIPAELMIEILVGATDALVNPQKLSQLNLSPKTGLTTIVSIFLEGVLTGQQKTKKKS